MKGKLLGLAVALVAMAVIVNALALSSATVKNESIKVTIVSTDAALLAVQQGSDTDVSWDASSGKAAISLSGLQPDSVYRFSSAFKLKNNSANKDLSVTIGDLTTGLPSGIASVKFYNGASAVSGMALNHGATAVPIDVEVTVAPGATVSATPISVSFTVTGN